MEKITKYLIGIIILALSITAIYYYFKYQGVQDVRLENIEVREDERIKDIDSILEVSRENIKKLDSLSEIIKKIEEYEPPKVNNNDLPDANNRELDSIISSYYNR